MRADYLPNLLQHFRRYPSVTTDSRAIERGDMFFALRGDRFDGNQFAEQALSAGASLVVIDDQALYERLEVRPLDDKSTPREEQAKLLVENGLVALQELARAYRRSWQMPVLAITGSNGKTTTKELVATVLAKRYPVYATAGNFNNHIGLPLTILSVKPDIEMCILEMGANHQGEIAELCRIAEPTHGLITNIGLAHLEGFGGRAGIKKGKGELFDWLAANQGIGFVNLDQHDVADLGRKLKHPIEFRTSEAPSTQVLVIEIGLLHAQPNCRVAFLDAEGQYLTADTQLPGLHNFENIKAAIAIGKYFKVPGHAIAAALEAYQPDNARSQLLTHRGVDFYWDAYNANPSSVRATLDALAGLNERPVVGVLGEMLELGKESLDLHREIAHYALASGLEQLILVGSEFALVAQELNLLHFSDNTRLAEWFWGRNWEGRLVLVKGSRGVALEKLIE